MTLWKLGIEEKGNCWERQSPGSSFLVPTQPHNNGSWAWTISLLRDREPTELVPTLSSCMEISLLDSGSVNALRSSLLTVCTSCHLANPTCHICPLRGGVSTFLLQHERGTCGQVALQQLPGESRWPWETNDHY